MKASTTKKDELQEKTRELVRDLAMNCAGLITSSMGNLRLGEIHKVYPRSDVAITIRKTGANQMTLLASSNGLTGMVKTETVRRLKGYRVTPVTSWPKAEIARFAVSSSGGNRR